MNAKAIIPLVAGLAIAGLAAKLGFDFIKKAEGKPTETVQLWAPIEDVPRGVAIAEAALQPVEFPVTAVPPNAMTDMSQIVGRVPHTGAPAGVPIIETMLLPPGVLPGVRVPPGYRAVAVKVDESSGVDNHLEPGCHVDVVGVFTVRKQNRMETLARTILEDVEVAAVGDRLAPSAPTPGDEESSSKRRERPARAVTLLVLPENVPTLHLAETKGKIKLSMRGLVEDGEDPEPSAVGASIDENMVVFGTSGEPTEPDAEAINSGLPDWAEQMGGFLGAMAANTQTAKPEEADEPEEEPEPQAPQIAWVMWVYNGNETQVAFWDDMNATRPLEVRFASGTNIFQDEPPQLPPAGPDGTKPAKPNDKDEQKVEKGASDAPQSNTDQDHGKPDPEEGQADSQSEPEELFE